MYWYRDTKQDIPNTFDSLTENKFFSIPVIIYILDREWIKRNDIPDDVLKRVDEEIKFQLDPEEKNIKNCFAPNMRNEWFSVNDIIYCLQHGFMQMSKLPPVTADRVQYRINQIKAKKSFCCH